MLRRAVPCLSHLLALALAVYVSVAAASGTGYVVRAILGASGVILVLLVASAGLAGTLRRQWPGILLVGLAAMGLTVTGLITSLTRDSGRETGLVERVCRGDGQVSRCQQAFQSRWGSLPLGSGPKARRIPSVVIGVAFYTVLFVWFLVLGRPTPAERRWHLFPVCLTTAGAAMAVYLTVIMYTRLPAPCPLCLASHVVTGLLFVMTVLTWPRRGPAPPVPVVAGDPTDATSSPPAVASATGTGTPDIGSWHRPATALVLACVVAVLGMMDRGNQALLAAVKQYGVAYNRFAEDPDFMRWDLDRQPVVPWAVRREDSVRGPASAPFVAITYSDFQCPHCRTLAEKLDEVQRKFPGRLRVVFRHFPLDRSCNPLTKTYLHAFSCEAARAAEAARRLGGERAFWKMHDVLFAHQAELDRQPYAQLAEQIGLDSARFISEMNSPRTWERVRAHIERSKPFDVSTTPAVFLNGRRVRVWRSTAFWEAVLAGPISRPTTTAAPAGATSRAVR